MGNFVRGTEKSVFIFDQSLTDYLAEFRRNAIRLQEANNMLSTERALSVGPERNEAAKRRKDLSTWFVDQFDVLIERFKPFLALDKGTASHSAPE